jgi:dihydrofolate reductase
MRITMIAAMDSARAIGRGNAMPWRLPDDFRRFKALTVGRPVVMGHRTAVSIGRALPDRVNIVLSRSREAPFPGQVVARSLAEGIEIAARSVKSDAGAPDLTDISYMRRGWGDPERQGDRPEDAGEPGDAHQPEAAGKPGDAHQPDDALEIVIAGGGEIYAQALPLATDLRLTFVDTTIDQPDAFFPAWDAAGWRETAREHHPADERHPFAFDWVDLVHAERGPVR